MAVKNGIRACACVRTYVRMHCARLTWGPACAVKRCHHQRAELTALCCIATSYRHRLIASPLQVPLHSQDAYYSNPMHHHWNIPTCCSFETMSSVKRLRWGCRRASGDRFGPDSLLRDLGEAVRPKTLLSAEARRQNSIFVDSVESVRGNVGSNSQGMPSDSHGAAGTKLAWLCTRTGTCSSSVLCCRASALPKERFFVEKESLSSASSLCEDSAAPTPRCVGSKGFGCLPLANDAVAAATVAGRATATACARENRAGSRPLFKDGMLTCCWCVIFLVCVWQA